MDGALEALKPLYNGIHLCDSPDLDNVERLDIGYMPIMHHMMTTGLQIDPTHFEKMDKILTQDMEEKTEIVREITGYYCNLSSPQQVSELLFKQLKLKQARLKLTSTDMESTAWEVLVAIQHDHEAIPHIIEYKEIEKLRGTYVRPIPKLAVKRGRKSYLLPNLAQTRVPSGRNNCKEPNLLAMPNRTERGREVCEGFICDDGYVYLSVDVSQLEPRTSAHLSQDPALLRIYRNNEDIYSDYATAAFKLDDQRYKCNGYRTWTDKYDALGSFSRSVECENPEHLEPTWHYPTVHKKDHRFPAKTCILAWFYEVSASGLLEQMPVICANCHVETTKHKKQDCPKGYKALWTEDLCQELINAADDTYGEVIKTRLKFHKEARRYAKVSDMWGRILHVDAVRSTHSWVVRAALREAANFKIQGGGRGLVKLGETHIFDDMTNMMMLGDVADPVLDIHDELLTHCREDVADELGQYQISIFENVVPLSVPIKAGMAKAQTWGKIGK